MKKADIMKYQALGTLVAVAGYRSRDRLPYCTPAVIVGTEQPRKVYSSSRSMHGHTKHDGVLVEHRDRRTLEPLTREKPIGAPDGLKELVRARETVAPLNIIDTWNGYVERSRAEEKARVEMETRWAKNRQRKQALVNRALEAIGSDYKYAFHHSAGEIVFSERALDALLEKLPA